MTDLLTLRGFRATLEEDLEKLSKATRCWAGYEPVPGKEPYSKGSCRPSGAARKKTAAQLKDPEGGLTAAGRRHYERSGGSRDLKPGVKKPESKMTTEDMKRKGSWARRFYGQSPLPPLKKPSGEPTRLALTAKAWGEPVPRNEGEARAIAAKGKRLLAKAEARDKSAAVERPVFRGFAKEVRKRLEKDEERAQDPLARHRRAGLYKLTSDERGSRTGYHRPPMSADKPTFATSEVRG